MNELVMQLIALVLGGGFLGAIFTGLSVRSVIRQNNANALKTYQDIADKASEMERDASVRERESNRKANAVIDRLEEQAKKSSEENTKLKDVISAWSVGIEVLHRQIKRLEQVPDWKPNPDDLSFLDYQDDNKTLL